MAGSGHDSVTGLDDRTLGRIDLLLFDADYPDSAVALDDSWRVAVLASDARILADHEHARAAAVRAANERRDPDAVPVRATATVHRALWAIAFILGIVAIALVATPRGSVVGMQRLLPAGICAVVSATLLWWLEPRRANGSLWGSRVPAVLHLMLGMLWLLAAAYVLGFRWGEIDANHALAQTSGVTLLACAGVAAILLWARALRADRSGRQTGMARLTGDLIGPHDTQQVYVELDRWWATAGPAALQRDATRVRRVRREVLARLRLAMLITEGEERAASGMPEPGRWIERRR